MAYIPLPVARCSGYGNLCGFFVLPQLLKSSVFTPATSKNPVKTSRH